MKIYVASSWKNSRQPDIVKMLREEGHSVYDFKNPRHGDNGFSWREIDAMWEQWKPFEFKLALESAPACRGFALDSFAVEECDVLVLVLPCGKSAHLEAGFAAGKGKPVFALMEEKDTPELMYKWFYNIANSLDELLEQLVSYERNQFETKAYHAQRIISR